jgi:hypothetical protein
MHDAEIKCVVCGYPLAGLARCPECGQYAPPVVAPASTDDGYRPEPTGVHRGGGGPFRKLVTQGDQSFLVCPPLGSAASILVAVGVGALIAVPWIVVPMLNPSMPRWLLAIPAIIGILVLAGVFGGQLFASRDRPVLIIDHSKGTLVLNDGPPMPTSAIHGFEFVRYNLRGQRVTSVGLRRLAFDLGPDASPRYRQVELRAWNLAEVAEQLGQSLGVPVRRRDLGTIQGHDFMVY